MVPGVDDTRVPRKGCPSGISVWVLGSVDSRGSVRSGVSPRGPVRGISVAPPSLSEARGLPGRLPVSHEFLEVAASRVKGMSLGVVAGRRCRDVLRDFREVVLFLVLAGYSPNYVRMFFLEKLPSRFRVLSYRGVQTSVMETVKEAREGSLRVRGDFLDLLKKYDAGPWVHDSPDWLREQYGVSLIGCGANAPDVGCSAEPLTVPAEVPAGVGDKVEDLVRIREFLGCWEVYSRTVSGVCFLTSGDLSFGLSRGFVALLALKEKEGGGNA